LTFCNLFLDILKVRAATRGLSEQIRTQCGSIDALPFDDGAFDVIWSEGAIYNIGFQEGALGWKRYLKPGGILVVSEITWLTQERPKELSAYWQAEYPQIALASEKFSVLEQLGYSPCGYFVLPPECWTDHYYTPIQERLETFLQRHSRSKEAQAIAAAERAEIELYRKHQSLYSYGMYIARVPL
jgi:SAM-dependent methyltransferase